MGIHCPVVNCCGICLMVVSPFGDWRGDVHAC